MPPRAANRYNPRDGIDPREEVTDSMTANWAGAVVNTLVLAFFVVVALGIALGVYAARVMKRLEVLQPQPQAELQEEAE